MMMLTRRNVRERVSDLRDRYLSPPIYTRAEAVNFPVEFDYYRYMHARSMRRWRDDRTINAKTTGVRRVGDELG